MKKKNMGNEHSYFPILIERRGSPENIHRKMIIYTPEQLPLGVPFTVLETNAHVSSKWDGKTIMADWLRSHGYDGLYYKEYGSDAECSCDLHELMPCMDSEYQKEGCCVRDCRPGFVKKNADCSKCDGERDCSACEEDEIEIVGEKE